MAVFNLGDLFIEQWGYSPGGNINDLVVDDSDLVNRRTPTGNYGGYYGEDSEGREVFMPITLGDLFMPYVWMSVSGSKRIIETPLTERRGSVKELISIDDYRFSIKGFVIGHDGTFPEKDIEDLRKLFELNEAIEMKCPLSDIFLLTADGNGQDRVVITELTIHEAKGIEHVRGFDMTVVTDQELELELID